MQKIFSESNAEERRFSITMAMAIGLNNVLKWGPNVASQIQNPQG